jgi:hypothetical protein
MIAAAAAPLLAGTLFLAPFSPAIAKTSSPKQRNSDASPACKDASLAMLASPMAPWKGAPLRVIFTADEPLKGVLLLIGPNGKAAATSTDQQGGPPYFWYAEVAAPEPGKWHVTLTRQGASPDCVTVTREVTVARRKPPGPYATRGSLWPIHAKWDRATENLYSAWIEKMFDAPLDAEPSWPALHAVLRDRTRNVLFDYLGLREDEKGLIYQPDCADLPYFLRAYFAFKMGLPFGYAKCTRGTNGHPPTCAQWWNIEHLEPPPAPAATPEQSSAGAGLFGILGKEAHAPAAKAPERPKGLVDGFGYYVRVTVANGVQSGNGRTLDTDNNTDFYPVKLSQATLRPGTIYADPYGHILVLVRRVPQTDNSAGLFFAVDGQPDGTVARKRYWRGNFLFAADPSLGSPGFKRFRPVVRGPDGSLHRMTNEEIAKDPDYGDFSLEQTKMSVEQFYDRMDDVMSPAPLDPVRALEDTIDSLEEQVKTRVISVENGRKYEAGGGGVASMPDGAAIFETSGPWEDYATPSRDLRLLIAIDVVKNFPEHFAKRPDRYKMPPGSTVAEEKAQLEATLAKELATRKFTYTRSDGSPWTLTLQDVFNRAPALEMGYNLNDCVELRWGAPPGSKEASTCKLHAPAAQRAKMASYRDWFHDRTRPPG